MPVPSLAIKLLFGEVSELILSGRKALPKKLLELGYTFGYADVKEALSDAVTQNKGHDPLF
jgi:NAD dependent epimerase/dehydratase family enzyme